MPIIAVIIADKEYVKEISRKLGWAYIDETIVWEEYNNSRPTNYKYYARIAVQKTRAGENVIISLPCSDQLEVDFIRQELVEYTFDYDLRILWFNHIQTQAEINSGSYFFEPTTLQSAVAWLVK